VIFFRDQNIAPRQFLTFAERFGIPTEYPLMKGIAGFPAIIEVKKLERERNAFGAIWHSDTVYLDEPPMGTMLVAREAPPSGGDTLFANTALAFEKLSAGLQRMLSGLKAVHSSAKGFLGLKDGDCPRADGRDYARAELRAEHPVVRTHPETGRKALYINLAHTLCFAGMSVGESAPILEYLYRHQTRPEFTCRFAWQPGSIAFWDNRCTQHNAVNDYHGFRRAMHRIILVGDRPR
jgi:taurine dioxygenase